MHRLHVPPARLAEGPLSLGGEDYHYLARVLRLGRGETVALFDGAGREAAARVVSVDGEAGRVDLEVAAPVPVPRTVAPPAWLLLSLLKGERMDLVLQKATELGVAHIVPVAAARSVVRLGGERAEGRLSRWQKIVTGAARQCGRADLPVVHAVATFAEALALAPAGAWKVLLHEGARAASLRTALPARPPGSVVVAIGPEGGFEPAEVEQAAAAGYLVAGFGPRIMRAETAALAALAILGFALGDLG